MPLPNTSDSIASAEARVLAAPREPAAWLALARAHWQAGAPQGALAACDGGLRVAPDAPDLICAKAEMLRALGRAADASALFHQALRLEPARFEARFGLALIAAEAGRWDEAGRWSEGLRAEAPARADLGWLAARIALGRAEPATALGEIDALLSNTDLAEAQRAELLLLKSQALDAVEETRAAFAAAVAGKTLQRRLHAAVASGHEAVADRYRRLAAWFGACDREPWRKPPPAGVSPAAAHVFLVGFPRSGTTLLEQALAGHSQVAALEEAPTLAPAHAEFLTSDAGLAHLGRLSPAEADHWRGAYWAEVAARGIDPRGRTFVDKAPAGTDDLPLVARLFPGAKVLFALRDPRDVVLSCLRHNFQMNAVTYAFTDLAAAAEAYDAGMAMAQAYRACLPLELMEVRHEALVDDLAGELTAICGFLGLEFQPSMMDLAATAKGRIIRTPSAPQVRAGLNRRGLGRWRAYADDLAPVLPTLAPWVERFGYEA